MKKIRMTVVILLTLATGFYLGQRGAEAKLENPQTICRMTIRRAEEILRQLEQINAEKLDNHQHRVYNSIRVQTYQTLQRARAFEAYQRQMQAEPSNRSKKSDLSFYAPCPAMQTRLREGVWSNMLINDPVSYFAVTLPDGRAAYTRYGDFVLNDEGEIVTREGYPLLPRITGMPAGATDPVVTESGLVQYVDPSSGDTIDVGQVMTYQFYGPEFLEPLTGNYQIVTDASGPATMGEPDTDGFGSISSGYCLTPMVDFTAELSQLMIFHKTLASWPTHSSEKSNYVMTQGVER